MSYIKILSDKLYVVFVCIQKGEDSYIFLTDISGIIDNINVFSLYINIYRHRNLQL